MSDVNRINISNLKNYKNTFDDLKNTFKDSAYSTFQSGYVRKCSDPYVTKMKANLTIMYDRIQNGYNSIDIWWKKYNKSIEEVEKYLSEKGGTVSESNILGYLNSLPKLEDFQNNDLVEFTNVSTKAVSEINKQFQIFKDTIPVEKDLLGKFYEEYYGQSDQSGTRKIDTLDETGAKQFIQDKTIAYADHAFNIVFAASKDTAEAELNKGFWESLQEGWNNFWECGFATVTNFSLSLIKGISSGIESLLDAGVVVLSVPVSLLTGMVDVAAGTDLSSSVQEMTQTIVGTDCTQFIAEQIGQTEVAQSLDSWMREESLGYDVVQNIGVGAGEVVSVLAITYFTGGTNLAVYGGMSGVGSASEMAYQTGADYWEGVGSGLLRGGMDSLQWYLGGKVSNINKFVGEGAGVAFKNSAYRVSIDSALGLGDYLYDPITKFYQDGYYDENGIYHSYENMNPFEKYGAIFSSNGGFVGLASNVFIGGGLSVLGETFDLKRFFGENKAVDVNIEQPKIKQTMMSAGESITRFTKEELDSKLSRLKELMEFTQTDEYRKLKNIDKYTPLDQVRKSELIDQQISSLKRELQDSNELKELLASFDTSSKNTGLSDAEIKQKMQVADLKQRYETLKMYASLNPEDVPNMKINYDMVAKQMKEIEDKLGNDLPQTPFNPSTEFQKYYSVEQLKQSGKNLSKEIKEFSVTSDNLNVGNKERLDIERLKTLSLEEQKNIIDHFDTFNLESLCGKELQLSPEIKTILDNKIIADQDRIVLDAVTSFSKNNICRYIVNNSEIVKQLDDHNLAHMLSSATKANGGEAILEEAMKRIDQGRNIFGQAEIERSLFGMVSKNLYVGASILPDEYVDKIWDLGNQEIKRFFPEEMSSQMTFFQRSTISNLIKNNNLDENGNRIIKKLFDESPTNLKFFNFNVLDKSITNLFDDDFLMTIGKYTELGDKIVSLKNRNPELLKIYSQIVKNSNLDDSLNNRYVKSLLSLDFLFENQNSLKDLTLDNTDLDTLTDYILFYKTDFTNGQYHMGKVVVDLNNHFYNDLYDQCDNMFDQALKTRKLKDMKSAYFQKFFSITESDARGILEKYGKHLGEIDDLLDDTSGEHVKTVLDYFNKVVHCEDVGELADIYENQLLRLSPEEMLHFDSLAALKYTETYEKAFLKTKQSIDSLLPNATQLDYNGKIINILEAPDEFSMLVHSSDTGFVVDEKALINDSYIDSWKQGNNPKVHGLATSFITNNNLGIAPVQGKGVIYAFYDLKASDIFEMGPYDINSNIANYGFESANTQIFISADKMSSNTRRLYNEFVLSRFDSKPSCVIVYRDMDQNLLDNAYKAASEWDIPIVTIDKVKIVQNQMNQVNLKLDEFANTKDLKTLSEALDIYESGKSGFKLNEIAGQEQQLDTLEAIDNSQLNKMYDSSKIKSSIEEYINMLKDSADSENSWKNLQDILEDELEKYRVVNENGTKLISQTELTVDIQKYLDEIKQHVHS